MDLDSDDTDAIQKMHALDQEILHLSKAVIDKHRNKYVRITRGWRKGEKGAKAIITDGGFINGCMYFLCMAVTKKDKIINGDAWTREYRPASDFELWEERPQND
jgi:hypothetical protein